MATHMKRHHPSIKMKAEVPSNKIKTEVPEAAAEDTSLPTTSTSSLKPVATGQLTLNSMLKSKLSYSSLRAKQITRAIGVFIATDLRPFSVVDQPGFKKMIDVLEPRYSVPTRQHFSEKIIPELYAETRRDIELAIAKADHIAITTDGWTSRATVSYNTITGHFIDSSWSMRNPVLQTLPMYESHTGVNIGTVLKEAMATWGIKGANVPVVSDNASNMVIAVKESGLGPHIRCFAHTLNLGTQRGLKTDKVARLLGKVRRVVSFFHRSSVAANILKQKQKMLGLPIHKLLMDVPTRWNSSYDLLERFIEQQTAIIATMICPEVRKSEKDLASFSDQEITQAEEAVEILAPIKKITTVMCDEKDPSISMLYPLKLRVLKFARPKEGDSTMAKELKAAIHKDMVGRYEEEGIKMFLLQSSCLDPRFRSLSFLSPEERVKVYDAVQQSTCSHAVREVKFTFTKLHISGPTFH